MKKVAAELNDNIIIIPSSVHEVLFSKESEMCANDVNDMIKDINRTQVPEDEVLSNHAYLYHRETEIITSIA